MIKITVVSRNDAINNVAYPLKEKTAIISIYNTTQTPVRFPNDMNIIGVCYLMFEDVDAGQDFCMEPEQGKEIRSFLKEVGPLIDRLLIHCNFGFCRSAAVAAAILEATMGSGDIILKNENLSPNMHVYYTVLNELVDKDGRLTIQNDLEFEYEDKSLFLK